MEDIVGKVVDEETRQALRTAWKTLSLPSVKLKLCLKNLSQVGAEGIPDLDTAKE
jgi:hypothetical protein